ncbi:hypothetical protein BGX31_002714 [Mortierella sp. GBA43]|nr:hypothetical protein BGX31_002714 [Mortierella sp. GBA43]
MDHPEQGWTLIRPAEKNVKYKVEHHFGYFYIHTNQGTPNFKVLRYPVKSILSGHDSLGDSVPARVRTLSPSSDNKSFLDNMKDDVVLMYDPSEFMQRLIVFARYFVTWAWRDGLQEIRIYSAPQPGNKNVTLSLTEIQRIRPYRENVNVVTVVPSTGRDFDDRVFMDYNSSKLQYSNSSYVHPWALYEVDMDMLTPVESRHDGSNSNDGTRLMSATTLVCQNPFPLNVMYGESTSQPTLDIKTHKDFRAMHQQAIARYKEERIMVPSRQSGISIPVTLVYYQFPDRPQFPRKAAFVKAYGAYGVMTKPDYDPGTILPLLHRGVIWVKVHPRGDGNMGPEWRTSGQGEHKRNTFYDIEDALVFLRDSGMVAKEGVVFEGMSAGGMDSGWIANRWGDEATPSRLPYNRIGQSENIVREMVKAVMAQVPFMDVLKGMGDPNVPWVEYEWAEWGSPLNDKRVFEAMKTFSPYDNIRHQDYPAMMLTGELADTRVSYAEALKFVAKLRSTDGKTNDCQPVHDKANEDGERRKMCAGKNDTPLLFQIGNGGHFGSSISLWMAFGLHQLDAEDVVIT